ncbi:MAG: M3 family oligoendopeptidase [Firmicutes bacterium]|nr:M3 family oligoendopeptidase [Bacillota bacterium]
MSRSYVPTWDLDVIFPGGSRSPALARHLESVAADIQALPALVEALPGGTELQHADVAAWHETLERLQDVSSRLREASAFVGCLTAQDVKDQEARLLAGRIRQLGAQLDAVYIALGQRMLAVSDAAWQAVLRDPRLAPIAFPLDEMRRHVADRLPPDEETLASALAVDGYHGWGEMYDVLVGRIAIPFEEDGQTRLLSVGQAAHRLEDPDRSVRVELFARWERAWAEQAELFATVLNHLAGFRLNLYRRRGWHAVLKEPLEINRMSPETLEAMWAAVESRKERLLPYLERKARLMGVDGLSWHDRVAPSPRPGDTGARASITYTEAAEFVVEQFGRFIPEMASFALQAFERRWVEAEDRPGKQPGGFCTTFPVSRQSRIFMTFGGTPDGVRTLAHELGHAFHQHVMHDLPALAQRYPMSLAETASTFAELVMDEAALGHASDPWERAALLEEKIQRLISFCMNIHARFLFEKAMYEARQAGPLSVQTLNELMLQAQRQAYRGALSQYHPHFWASKLHFYITRTPFYNFPYTFGFLFSNGVYVRARADGPRFAERYVALLRDTGRMTVEELAHRHLGVDLRQTSFWEAALDSALADVDAWLALTG